MAKLKIKKLQNRIGENDGMYFVSSKSCATNSKAKKNRHETGFLL